MFFRHYWESLRRGRHKSRRKVYPKWWRHVLWLWWAEGLFWIVTEEVRPTASPDTLSMTNVGKRNQSCQPFFTWSFFNPIHRISHVAKSTLKQYIFNFTLILNAKIRHFCWYKSNKRNSQIILWSSVGSWDLSISILNSHHCWWQLV